MKIKYILQNAIPEDNMENFFTIKYKSSSDDSEVKTFNSPDLSTFSYSNKYIYPIPPEYEKTYKINDLLKSIQDMGPSVIIKMQNRIPEYPTLSLIPNEKSLQTVRKFYLGLEYNQHIPEEEFTRVEGIIGFALHCLSIINSSFPQTVLSFDLLFLLPLNGEIARANFET
jgi:hypothetical protein